MHDEEWRVIPGHQDFEVSSIGRVRRRPRLLKPQLGTYGHLRVSFMSNGKRVVATVHSLVALAFIGPRPPGLDVCHGDLGQHVNTPNNLRYDTRKANLADTARRGLSNRARGERVAHSKLKEGDIVAIRRAAFSGEKHRELAARYGVNKSQISCIVNMKTWKHVTENGERA